MTAGIDFAFHITEEIAGKEVAARIQLGLEYDPTPANIGGTPGKAIQSVVDDLESMIAPKIRAFDLALDQAMMSCPTSRDPIAH